MSRFERSVQDRDNTPLALKNGPVHSSSRRLTRPLAVTATRSTTVIMLILLPLLLVSAIAFAQPVGLGTAGDFAVLAGSTITNTGPTTITGDVGLHPGSSVTGFNSVTLNGDLHAADAVAEQAKVDLVTAYNDTAGEAPTGTVATELGGQTLTPGVYNSASGTFEITGTLTLDAGGDPDAVFIFQMASTLVTAADSTVNVINGADACNVFWQVGSSATLGTSTTFRGTILALTSISLTTGATVEGRALARNGAVTMDTNTITQAACQQATPTTTTSTPGATTSTMAPPVGGVSTGGGSTAGVDNVGLLLAGGVLLAGAVGAFAVRRGVRRKGS